MADRTDPRKAGGRLTPDEAALFAGHVSGLTAAGLPLGPGLRAAAAEMPDGRLRGMLETLATALDSGASFDEIVGAAGDRLPGHLRGLVQVGAKTGRLSEVLGRFVAYLNVGVELRRRLWVGLAYPVLLLVLAFALAAFVCSTIVGSFENIFKDFGVKLPLMTTALLNVAHLFRGSWQTYATLGVVVVVIFAVLSFLSPRTRRSLIGGIPVLGLVARNTALAEFCHLLGLLLESELPLGEAVRLTGEGVNDATLDRACRVMGSDVDAGLELSQAIGRQPLFPKGLARVLRWAEGNQSLAGSLHMAGEMFEARARSQATFVGTVLSVMAVISVIVGVGWMVISMFLPLITLISKLSG